MELLKTCFYCDNDKPIGEFSKEHIIPKAIGGVISTRNPFLTEDVCKRCNNAAGYYIDAPFSKSYFINNYRAQNAAEYLKLTPKTILPLSYMGEMKEVNFEGKICEMYLGPTGDRIYHFHLPYPAEPDIPRMVGTPPHLRNRNLDDGFVFLFLRSNNPKWVPTIFYSTIDAFPNSTYYFGNGVVPRVKGATFYEIPENLKEVHKKLSDMNGKMHEMQITMGVDYANRFMAKLALGMGSIHLNEEFKKSTDAFLLREFMWSKTHEERKNIPVRGRIYGIENEEQIKEIMKWAGAHVISLQDIGGNLVLYTCFYGQQSSMILISSNPTHWRGKIDTGLVYILFPERQECVGPLLLEEFLAYKLDNYPNEILSKIQQEIDNREPLPPFIIKEEEGGVPSVYDSEK